MNVCYNGTVYYITSMTTRHGIALQLAIGFEDITCVC